jgi:hypothetical protein
MTHARKEKYGFAMPDYDMAVRTRYGRMVLETLGKLGGEATFEDIKEEAQKNNVRFSLDTLSYYLDSEESDLRRSNVIEKVGDRYRLKHRTTFCWLMGGNVPITFIGMLGLREYNPEPEPKTFLFLLEENKEEIGPGPIDKNSAYILTTSRAMGEWGSEVKGLGIEMEHFIECSQYDIQNIGSMKAKVLFLLNLDEMRDKIVVLDCTGLTKPATIAFYEVARDFYFPLVYVYGRSFRLLISREYVRERLFIEGWESGPYDRLLERIHKSEQIREDLLRILNFIGQKNGVAGFNQIGRSLGYVWYKKEDAGGKGGKVSKVTKGEMLKRRLTILVNAGLVEQVAKGGPYKLKYKTPFYWLNTPTEETEFAYYGLLGDRKRAGWEIETRTALTLLRKEYNITPTHIIILTTPKGYDAWYMELREMEKEYRFSKFHYNTCLEHMIEDFNAMKDYLESDIQRWLEKNVVIFDCTGLTKPATLALYEIARTYYAPLIYIYGRDGEGIIHWIIEKDAVGKKFGFRTLQNPRQDE